MNDTTPLAQLSGFDKLGGRAQKALDSCTVFTLADLKQLKENELKKIKNCGKGTRDQILDFRAVFMKNDLGQKEDSKKKSSKKSSVESLKGGQAFDDMIVLDEIIEERDGEELDTGLIVLEAKRIRFIERGIMKFTRVAYDSEYEISWHKVTQSVEEILKLKRTAMLHLKSFQQMVQPTRG